MTVLTGEDPALPHEIKFQHECPEWDFMVIDEWDAEFAACSCFVDQEAKAHSEARQREYDLRRLPETCIHGNKIVGGGQCSWCASMLGKS